MKECVLVGYPNSGKTLFALNFAAFLGSKSVEITFRSNDGLLTCRQYSLSDAKNELCSSIWHKTRMIQTMIIKMTVGKALISFKLTDTCGLCDGIHADQEVRHSMAYTLSAVRSADFIIHIVDLSRFTSDTSLAENAGIDNEIYHYGVSRRNYIILANKTDLPLAASNVTKVVSGFAQAHVIPISALHQYGFKEVKAYVARNV